MAATHTTTGNGNWENAAIWDSGVPHSGDNVVINHTVNINTDTSDASYIKNVGDFTLNGGATLTHTVNSSVGNPEYKIYIIATGNIVITGDIDANAKGYTSGPGQGTGVDTGGSYGGYGSYNNGGSLADVGTIYGTIDAPFNPGSGGTITGGPAREGGGVVRLEAVGTITVNGNIVANGEQGADGGWNGGGGSGGSIWLDADTIAGGGAITASGGPPQNNDGGGGGGRIALFYNTMTFPIANVTAASGNWTGARRGSAGTIYVKDNAVSYGDLRIDNDNLTTLADLITLLPTSVITYNLNDLIIDTRGRLQVESSELIVAGDLTITNNSLLSHEVCTASDDIPILYIEVGGTLTLDVTSSITTTGNGYLGGFSGDNAQTTGKTDGNVDGSTTQAGGSHGGLGEAAGAGVPAPVYGTASAPAEHGGGGGADGGGHVGGDGGGRIYIKCADISIDGDIVANGSNGAGANSGGGAGGSVYIETYEYAPTPTSGQEGTTLNVVFTGIGTQWDGTSSIVFSPNPGDITVNSFVVAGPTSATANITIAMGAFATASTRTVTITGGAGVDVIASPGAVGTISADGGTDGGAGGGGGGGRIAIYCEAALIDPGVTITVSGGA